MTARTIRPIDNVSQDCTFCGMYALRAVPATHLVGNAPSCAFHAGVDDDAEQVATCDACDDGVAPSGLPCVSCRPADSLAACEARDALQADGAEQVAECDYCENAATMRVRNLYDACSDVDCCGPQVDANLCDGCADIGDRMLRATPLATGNYREGVNMIREALEGIARETIAAGGGTFLTGNGAPAGIADGYMVGGIVPSSAGCAATVDAIASHIAAFLAREDVATALAGAGGYRSGTYLGTWIDGNGRCIVDLSECYASEADALHVASVRSEDAIWSNSEACEIAAR